MTYLHYQRPIFLVSRLMLMKLFTAVRLFLLPCALACVTTVAWPERSALSKDSGPPADPSEPTPTETPASKDPDATPEDKTPADDETSQPSLSFLKSTGLQRSRFVDSGTPDTQSKNDAKPEADLQGFASNIQPILDSNCIDCHGPDTTEGNIRIDTLDPNLLSGPDTDWWSEIFSVITKGEMPPPDYGSLEQSDESQIVEWLSRELQNASIVRRFADKHSAFRRMTRYEYNYALQDLLGLPYDFAKDLPPEAHSEEGFENSSELLHLSVSQFQTYHRIARRALQRATVEGDRPPTRYWSISMADAAAREWPAQEKKREELRTKHKDNAEALEVELEKLEASFRKPPGGVYYWDLESDRKATASWQYYGAKYAFAPSETLPPFPALQDCVAVLPQGNGPRLIVELGNQLPDEGTLRVTVRASRKGSRQRSNSDQAVDNQTVVGPTNDTVPTLQLMFGWQASNEGRALLPVGKDTPVIADPDAPQLIQWDVPLGEIYPRNSVRKTSRMGAMPSPSEYIRLVNSAASKSAIQIDHVQVAAPVYEQWPPQSHRKIFFDSVQSSDEANYAREVIDAFMHRAWRRPIDSDELNAKLQLFESIRPECHSLEEAVTEVLATVLSSPQFLYVAKAPTTPTEEKMTTEASSPGGLSSRNPVRDDYALAGRMATFLWCSVPDEELLTLAKHGELHDAGEINTQILRMLNDPRSERFAQHFVHQWLDLQLLEFQNFKQHVRGFDPLLKEAMLHEPVALFEEILSRNNSVLDFIHCNYAVVNERLAKHYGLSQVEGNHFRRVELNDEFRRGGLLTQAGLLAMNSDYPDSHPLKRAIWLLESVLGDPPPPPPPAVPQIDLADPEIAKMTLKERIEDHRNHAACMSCHVKIDPWGIAFENYDALGKWRDEIKGKPIDAASELFNHQTLDGMHGLKRFLLENRQDQFVRAMVSKLATFALGRPLSFGDRAEIDAITARVRREGDGLRTMIEAIIESDLFQNL